MGNRESNSATGVAAIMQFEEAKALLSADEVKRLETAWGGRESMSCEDFFTDVLCHSSIPAASRSFIYAKFCGGATRLTYQNFLIAIVILTKAKKEYREKFLFDDPELQKWIDNPPQLTSHLSEIHYNFYQVLAGVTHLDEHEVEELEKVFGSINDTKLCKLTRNGFGALVAGVIDECFVDGLFRAFDENGDGLIDFKELVCALSASCRGPDTARLHFVAQIFDSDGDGNLTKVDIAQIYESLHVDELARTLRTDVNGKASLTDFVCWANETSCVDDLVDVIQQIGHICLGLRPAKPDVELKVVSSFKRRVALQAFPEWNIVSLEWYRQWVQALTCNLKVPPINNSAIIASKAKNDWTNKAPSLSNEGAPLHAGLQEGKDYDVLAPCLWRALLRWHGSAVREGISLPRRVVPAHYLNGSHPSSELAVELYPLTLLILRHTTSSGSWLQFDRNRNANPKQAPWCSMSLSRVCTVSELLALLTQQLRINDVDSARLWTVEIDGVQFRRLLDDDSLTLFDLNIKKTAQLLLELRNADMSWPEEVCRLETASSEDGSENEESGGCRGVTGIFNMGNTCYMNSAIQCLSNTRPLTEYFMEGRHKENVKRRNGIKGTVALEYGNLIEELWSGKKRNIAPIKLKEIVSAHAGGVFAERSQHDCQEFLSILLDLLHEDLNQITSKPYIELHDSDGRPDVVVANEAWEAHLRREQSIIVDLFTGQLRSSLKCLTCGTVSSRFDAFTCLQLPIPIDNLMLIPVVVVKRDGHVPTRYGFRLSPATKIKEFKNEIAQSSSLHPDSFKILCLNRAGQMMRNVSPAVEDENSPISSYPGDAMFYAFELPAGTEMNFGNGFVPAPTVIASHRKMQYNDSYLLGATRGCTIRLFGVPLFVRFLQGKTTGMELYEEVWFQVSRFLRNGGSDRTQRAKGTNRAVDAGEDIRSGYPFDLCTVDQSFEWCSHCPWSAFCRGCVIPRGEEIITEDIGKIAVDWKPTALYLRYQHSVELLCIDDSSVLRAWDVHYKPCSLTSCLNDFTRAELLDERIQCKKCKERCPTTKSLSIWRLPKILIIHFKRFVYVETDRRWVKSCKVVDFPLSELDLSEWCLNPDTVDRSKYSCFAIANHYGAMASGHYVAYAKNRDQWFVFNDSRCQAVKETHIDKKSAYLLFYERIA